MAEPWQTWMPHMIDAWQGSADVQALSDLAYRAVHNLILDMWKQEDCALPNDDRELAKRSRVAARWMECREEVLDYFRDRTESGKITHRVTRREWEKARERFHSRRKSPEEIHEARKAAGRAGAAARWQTDGKPDGKPMANAIHDDGKPMATCMANNGLTGTGTETRTEKTKTIRAANRAECELVFLAYPRRVGKDKALDAIAKAAGRLVAGADLPAMTLPEALEYLRARASTFARSPAGNAGEYTPHPATWFNQGRYLDPDTEWQRGNNATSEHHRPAVSRGVQRVDEALDQLRKAGVEAPDGRPEAGADEVRPAPWGGGGRDSPGIVLEGSR